MMRKTPNWSVKLLFPAETDRWLSVLRLGLGVQIILYCLSLRKDWDELFSLHSAGLIKRDLTEAILSADSHFIPRLGWLVDLAAHFGLGEHSALSLVWWTLLGTAVLLCVGFCSRVTAILAALCHLCAVKSTGALTYGLDNFTTIGLFYLCIAPLPDRLALDFHFLKDRPRQDRHLQGFYRRVLQLHLCLIYFFGGVAKCAGKGWWDGTNVWRALIRPPFNVMPPEWLVASRHFFPALGILVCLLETGYCIFIWPKVTRWLWLVAIMIMHISIGVSMGMYLFALIMIILNVAAFGTNFIKIPFAKTRLTLRQA